MRYFALVFFLTSFWLGLRFVFSGATTPPDLPTLRVAVSDLLPGAHKIIDWEGRPVLIMRRDARMQSSVDDLDPALLHDPASADSVQPKTALAVWRSRDPAWFVAIAVGTDLGCPVRVAEPAELPAGLAAGLRDTCRGAFYDLAGRVLDGQQADENLTVPSYRLDGDVLVLGAD